MPTDQSFTPQSYTLPAGSIVTVRALRASDARRLQAFVSRLSPQSIYFRFLSNIKGLSDAEAERLVHVDYDRQMALAATLGTGDEELIIAVARYAAHPTHADWAEAAIVIEDQYQRQGLGRELIRHLARYARGRGFSAFTGTLSGGNLGMKKFLQQSGFNVKVQVSPHGELDIVAHLDEPTP